MVSWIGVLAGLAVIVGALSALLWARIVHLPAYVVGPDHVAVMSEHGQTEVFAADAWFVVIGLVAGLVLGGLAWSWFRAFGSMVAFVALGSGLLAGGVCWGVGQLLGPGSFEVRLAHANPGDSVTIAFRLHSPTALAAWGLASVLPTLIAAVLSRDGGADSPDAGPRGRLAETAQPEESPVSEPSGSER